MALSPSTLRAAVEARGQAEIGAVVHDERDARQDAAQLTRLRQGLAHSQPLGAILHQGAAGLGQRARMPADRLHGALAA